MSEILHVMTSGRNKIKRGGSGDSEQDVFGSAGMLAEPIRLLSDYIM